MSIKKMITGILSFVSVLVLAACSGGGEEDTVRLGVIGEDNEAWEFVADKLADESINLEIVTFTEYSQPNRALADGDIDLNAFQHRIFLENFNEEFDTDLVPIADTNIAPLGLFSEEITDVSEIEEGDQISIPNDVTNGGRALILLQTAGLIEVDPEVGITPTVDDITDNPLNLEIVELDASQTARSLGDVTAAIINSGMAVDAGFIPSEDSIFLEPVDEKSEPYINIIAARADDDREVYDKVVDAYQSEDTLEIIQEQSKGSSFAVWAEDLNE